MLRGWCVSLLWLVSACSEDVAKPSGSIAFDLYPTGWHVRAIFDAADRQPVSATIGPCEVSNPPATAPMPVDAGLITVSGPVRFFWQPDAAGNYEDRGMSDPIVVQPGDAIAITAPGHIVPAFNQAVGLPTPIVVTEPVLPTSIDDSLAISRRDDFAISWTGGNEVVRVTLRKLFEDQQVTCRFPASDGRGVVPKQALAALGNDPDRASGADLSIESIGHDEFHAGEWRVLFDVALEGVGATVDISP
jgi:hypothetical protein